MRDLRDGPASFDKIQDFPPELGCVTSGHIVLRGLLDGDHPVIRLRRTRGTSVSGIAGAVQLARTQVTQTRHTNPGRARRSGDQERITEMRKARSQYSSYFDAIPPVSSSQTASASLQVFS
jgi:hypothetical protein